MTEGRPGANAAVLEHGAVELHRQIVAIPSVSGEEAELATFMEGWLQARGMRPWRAGNTLLATVGEGPLLLLDSHLDTVPPAPGWSRDPFAVHRQDGRVYGLGANDAKASVAAMAQAFVAVADEPLPFALGLALVEGEETRGEGTGKVLSELERRGQPLLGAVFGEPTGLDLAVAQKGLLVLELIAAGDACHAAHAGALGARNAALALARDLVTLAELELAPDHPRLGPTTLQPTTVHAGTARNVIPGEARAVLDVRTTPAASHREVVARVCSAVTGCEVEVLSERLEPRETAEDAPLVQAALRARPGARLYGSPTLSDLVFVHRAAAIKCGPGASARSHTPDEWVFEEEVTAGARFYAALVREYAETASDRAAQEARA